MPYDKENSDEDSFSRVVGSSLLDDQPSKKLDDVILSENTNNKKNKIESEKSSKNVSSANFDDSDNSDNSDEIDSNNLNSDDISHDNSTHTHSKKKLSGNYNPRRVREFLIRLAKACKRHEIRIHARKQFHEHTDKLKNSLLLDKPHHDPDSEIEELRKRVDYLISVERSTSTPDNSKVLNEKINQLESKLNRLLQSKIEREKRFEELERKLSLKHKHNKDLIVELEKKLFLLERKLIEHQIQKKRTKSKIDTETLNQIKNQINKTKQVIQSIKD
jgi:hypothetical protein